jgi:4-hydroxy-3-methylbut-2-en-1-yl diphosphate reductase
VAVRVKERFPDVWTPGRSDLCFATTNRQAALMELAHRCDVVVVIGSGNSSNTRALERLARDEGCERVYRVNSVDELPSDLAGIVGVTAGASAPEELVVEVVEFLAPKRGVELVDVTEEDEYFPPPRNIRDLQASIETAASVLLGGSLLDRPGMDDRSLGASDVLASLNH